jgi:hypothetical protein
VAKFDSDTDGEIIPDEITNHDSFIIQEVSDRSALVDATVDQTGLSQSDKDALEQVYPVQ